MNADPDFLPIPETLEKRVRPMRFRKIPIIVEARYWDGSAAGAGPIIDWILAGGHSARYHDASDDVPRARTEIVIDTLEGAMSVFPGGYVIKGIAGEFYPCRGDIFGATYEPLDDTDTAAAS